MPVIAGFLQKTNVEQTVKHTLLKNNWTHTAVFHKGNLATVLT